MLAKKTKNSGVTLSESVLMNLLVAKRRLQGLAARIRLIYDLDSKDDEDANFKLIAGGESHERWI